MKTPREILLGRHQAVEPKLDKIRREVVADTEVGLDRRASRNPISSAAPASLRELILSLRWHVAAMSAVWLVAALLSIDRSPAASPTTVSQVAQSPQRFLIALQENRRQLLEMIEPPVSQPRSAQSPRRRSELQPSTAMA
ncbi:MAG: hypothetical protein ABSA97_06670 [Verrucomicrobiia bacterium]|jgi:hypothetical protein